MALALTLALTLTLTLRGYYDRQSGRAELLARQRRRAPRDVATLAHHVRHTGGCLHRRPKVCCLGLRNPDPDPATLALALAKGPWARPLPLSAAHLVQGHDLIGHQEAVAIRVGSSKFLHRLKRLRRRQCRLCGRPHEHATQEEEEQHGQAPPHCAASDDRAGSQPSQPATDAVTQPFV